MNPQTYLSTLTFIGLFFGIVGGLVSQLRKTSVDVEGTTKKLLTPSGKLAVAISILGFSGSFASELLKSSIQAQEKAQAKIEARLKEEREREEAQWKSRSIELASEILRNTNSALAGSEENLRHTIEGFKHEQEGILKTRFDIAESRQKVLSDNLVREARLYGKISATSTPLTKMTIELTVEHVPGEILGKVRKGIKDAEDSTSSEDFRDLAEHHNVDDDDARSLVQSKMDKLVIQPFIYWLATGRFLKEQGILSLGLDKNFSTLLCVGWVSKPDITDMDGKFTTLPAGVLIGDEIEWAPGYASQQPAYRRKQVIRPEISLSIVNDSLVLAVVLGIESLNESLLRYSKNSDRPATLSDNVELFSWSPSIGSELEKPEKDVLQLPFDSMKVHDSLIAVDAGKNLPSKNRTPSWVDTTSTDWAGNNDAWIKSNDEWIKQTPLWMRHIRLQIIPNGVDQISKTYNLSLSSSGYPFEGVREEEPRGYVRIWHGQAR
jgi:hypothetical protein